MVSSLDKLHYSFCGDLGDKVIKEVIWPENINFALFKVKQIMGGSGRTIPNTEIFIPGLYEVQKVNQDFWTSLTEKEYQTFIAPSDYSQDGSLFYTRKKQLFIPVSEEIWNIQPHLPYHSTFQFYFLRNSLFTANLDYLDVGDFQGNGGKQIRVDWTVRATPSGTYVIFLSNHIFFKWKIEVRQGIVNMSLVKVMIDGVSQSLKGIGKAAGSFFGVNTDGINKAQEEIAGNLVGKDRGGSFMERERINRTQEQHTARMFSSTLSHTGDNPIEPSIFYANTVKFPYNLFDYWLRNDKEPFTCRLYYSNNLLNNLIHNNNANPITYPLDITFEKLGHILRPGFIQGRLDLDYDPGGKMTECFARGVTFYNDKKEHFVNPDLGVKQRVDEVRHPDTGGDTYIAQAITEGDEPWTNEITRTKGSNYHQRAHFFITYEDGTNDHWLVMFPQTFQDSHLAEGHHHGGFDLHFDKPVKEFIDVYTCIGCGAQGQGYTVLHPGYDYNNGVDSDSLDTIHKGLPYDPWFNEFTGASLGSDNLWKTPSGKCLGHKDDVWEFTGQYIRGKDNQPFMEAYGFIPAGGTIQWTTKGGGTRIEWQKVPQQDDFSQLDWSPPAGSGGDIEIPLEDPEIALPEPGENEVFPEDDFDPSSLDVGGGEVEIPPIEIDLPPDIDQGLDVDDSQDTDPPPIEIDVTQDVDQSQDQDNSQDVDQGDYDLPPDFPEDDPDRD